MIAEDVRKYIHEYCRAEAVADVRIGMGYTAVLLRNGSAGVAYTFKEGLVEGCSVFEGKRPLAGRSSHDLIDYLGSSNLIESTVGLATVNALVNRKAENEGDILKVLDVQKKDRVGMVGFFGPLVSPLKKTAKELLIFEQSTVRAPGLIPSEEASSTLSSCDIALITSTSLINGTMDALLEAAGQCREVVLLGASTPLIPEVFRDHHVTLLSGVIVTDSLVIARVVSEGGGMRFFKGYIAKANVSLKSASK